MPANDNSRPKFRVSVTAIVIFQGAALVARSVLERSLLREGLGRPLAEDASYLVVPPILLVLMSPYIRRCKDSLLALLRRSDLTLRLIIYSVLLGLTIRAMRWAFLTILIRVGAVGSDGPAAIVGPVFGFECPSPPVLLLSFGVMALLVPIVEEIGNRGFILHALLPRGVLASVVSSALLFAIMHKPSTYAAAFAIGLVLGLQMLNYRTLWGPILTHATYNASAVVDWECFRLVWNPPSSDPALYWLSNLSIAVIVAGIGATLFLISKKAGAQARSG